MTRLSTQAELLFVGNDLVLEVRDLANEVTGDFLNAATVTCTLVDATGVNVTGQTWPLALAYVPLSDGIYRATLPKTLGITAERRYVLKVDVDGGAGLGGHWEVPCLAKIRT